MEEQTNEVVVSKSKCNWVDVLFSIFVILLVVAVSSYGYLQLTKANSAIAQINSQLQNQQGKNKTDVTTLQSSIDELKQAAQKSQELSTKQEQMIASWQAAQKGDLNKWYVAEAQYLVKLANDHLQYSHDTSMALTLLQRADQVLQNIPDTSLLELRKSLATDVANLQAAPKVDVTALYVHLNTLDNQIDQLPLPINPLKEKAQVSALVEPANTPWWKVGIDHTWDALRKIVIVRNTNANALPLVLPDEKVFLFQNLHAQMQDAMWGVLHQNATIYQANLARAIAWIQQYFDPTATATKNMLLNLQDLQKENLQPPVINLTATMQLFDSYFAQAKVQ